MNVRKPVDYGTMYRELTAILTQNLSQMDEVYAIGKAISQRPEKGAAVAAAEFLQANFPDHTGFSPRNVRRMRDFYRTYENDQTLLRLGNENRLDAECGHYGSGADKRGSQVVSETGTGAAVVKERTAGHSQ